MSIAIPPPAVRAQVEKILASEPFARSRRIQRFLTFVVEETLAGRADQLSEYSIGIAVFDRGPDFEPGLDPIVRNDARRLRLKLLEYYRQLGSDAVDQLAIEIPKGGYAPLFFSVVSRDQTVDAAPGCSRRLAVLPFDDLSTVPEGLRIGRSLCMSLTASLTNLEGVETVAHSYLPDLRVPEAASELRLSHVIHGSVMRLGQRVHVVVNLIQVRDGAQLWAREFDFESHEMFTFHSEITRTVVGEVAARLGLRRSQPTLAQAA